jgi:AcrR family transcriptional regulator
VTLEGGVAREIASAKPARGRPRSEEVRLRILDAAIAELEARGLKGVTIESIAERAGASKVTIYRWWPNKAALATDAFLAAVAPRIAFPHGASALDDLRQQMISLMHVLTGRWGAVIASLIAEGIHDDEVGEAMRTRWLGPRRAAGRKVVERGVASGEIRADVDPEVVLDALYGPIYLRVMLGHGPLDAAFAKRVWAAAVHGIAAPSKRTRARR